MLPRGLLDLQELSTRGPLAHRRHAERGCWQGEAGGERREAEGRAERLDERRPALRVGRLGER